MEEHASNNNSFQPKQPEYSSSNTKAPRAKLNKNQSYDIFNYVDKTPQSARVQPPSDPIITSKKQYPSSPRHRSKHQQSIPKSPVVANGPISPKQALNMYSEYLTDYEKDEISVFPDIYYVGKKESKIEADIYHESNLGFDDTSNNYELRVGDHLAYRFEIVSLFGSGAFGQVIKCIDHKTSNYVAVKIIVNTEQMHEQGQIEAQILAKLNSTPQSHIVRAYDFFVFRAHICITFEILGLTLYDFSAHNNFTPLPLKLVRLYALQILSALDQVHKVGAIHCDIKPENILLAPGSKTRVKLVDFGSSCFDGQQKYFYIQSRFYRAPEVILGIPYGAPMDIWSTALVLIEMLTGDALFPGDDELEVLWMISQLIGPPPHKLVNQGNRKDEFFDDESDLKPIQNPRPPKSLNLSDVLKVNDPLLIDFLMKCLTWDQETRLTSRQALQHPWIRSREIKVTKQKSNPSMLPNLDASSRRNMCL